MRHAVLLWFVSVAMALLAVQAYQWDLARAASAQQRVSDQINADLLRLEQQYLAQARSLISTLDARDPLLDAIDASQTALAGSAQDRDGPFQALVIRIRARLLQAPATTGVHQQEWQRSVDQMNGALHRRSLLLEQMQGTH